MADLNIDVTNAEAAKSFDVIPPQWVIASIDSSEVRPTKKATEAKQYPTDDNQGSVNDILLQFTFKITEGEHKGRLLWERLNIRNANQIAQKIAEEQLAAICDAIGHARKVKDSVTLHGKPMRVKVDVEPAKEGQPARNVIKGYEALGARPAATAVGATPNPAPSSAPAWNRPKA